MIKLCQHIDMVNFFSNVAEIWIAVALLKKDIVSKILKSINIKNPQLIHFVVGIDLPTDPEALQMLYKRNCDVKIYHTTYTFHPKVYVVRKQNGRFESIIGSANATVSGFSQNIELSISNNDPTFCKSVLNWFEELRPKCLYINSDIIEQYKQDFNDRLEENLDRKQKNLNSRLKKFCEYVLDYKRQEMINHLNEKIPQRRETPVYTNRDGIVKKLRNFMDVENNFKSFDTDKFVKVAELGRIRTSHYNVFRQPEIIKSIAKVYTVPQNQLARAIDELCSYKFMGIGYASKILCVRDPKKFMVINGPVKKFLQDYGFKGVSSNISGKKYLEISNEIVQNILPKLNNIPDLAHFDALIW